MFPVNRPFAQYYKQGAEITAGASRQRDFGILRKTANPALAMEFTDLGWAAILRCYADHRAWTAEDRKIGCAAQGNWRFEDDSCMRSSVVLAGFGKGADPVVGFRIS